MTTFLFWNLYKKPLQQVVANLARRHEVDVLILAESGAVAPATMLTALNSPSPALYHYSPGKQNSTIQIYSKFRQEYIRPLDEQRETNRFTMRRLELPGLTKVLLVAVHLPSKLHADTSKQRNKAENLSQLIIASEQEVGHSNTLLVGDFNMDPFEEGLAGARGLHAVMSRSIAQNKTRRIEGIFYPYFYNPMWSMYGDASRGPPGTYYYNNNDHFRYFWHMFDQILIRPDLLDRFDNTNLQILETDGETSFLSLKGMPDTQVASDHLPLLFTLSL